MLCFIMTVLSGLVGDLILACITCLLVVVGWVQLSKINKTNSATFLLDIKKGFFVAPTRDLVQLVDSDWLVFEEKDELTESYFTVNEDKVRESELEWTLRHRLLAHRAYSVYDMDDLLLGHFEDLGMLLKQRSVDEDMVYAMFSWYVERAWENRAIYDYVMAQRKTDNTLYTEFEYLYNQCKTHGG